eukprot:SAG22_NODE_1872_length_3397_cov_1.584900_1_plen_182_part_00
MLLQPSAVALLSLVATAVAVNSPFYADPLFDAAHDAELVWHEGEQTWWITYLQLPARRPCWRVRLLCLHGHRARLDSGSREVMGLSWRRSGRGLACTVQELFAPVHAPPTLALADVRRRNVVAACGSTTWGKLPRLLGVQPAPRERSTGLESSALHVEGPQALAVRGDCARSAGCLRQRRV